MIKSHPALFLSTLLITCAAIANLVRLFWDIPFQIGSFSLPGWSGLLFFLGFGTLAIWAWKELIFSPPPTNPSNPSKR